MARVASSERFRRELDEVLAGVDGEPPALAAGARFARVLAGAEQDQASELGRSAPPTMPRVAASCRLRSRTNALTVRVHAQSEPDVTELVPSDAFPHGLAALERLVHEAGSVSAAVAFVTDSGVSALRELLDGRADIELVVRAGGITSPAAVLAQRND